MAYKEQQLTKPEVKLESEINLLKMEKVVFFTLLCPLYLHRGAEF